MGIVGGKNMDGKLRNMSSIYISQGNKMLLLYRQGSRVVNKFIDIIETEMLRSV